MRTKKDCKIKKKDNEDIKKDATLGKKMMKARKVQNYGEKGCKIKKKVNEDKKRIQNQEEAQ